MKSYRIPPELEPRYIMISSTIGEDGLVQYMITSQQNGGSRIKSESWGYARPTCHHLKCRWWNLVQAAQEWTDLAIPAQGLDRPHLEQLGLDIHPT